MSTVEIVMATYNGEKYVGEQIESILASTYQDFILKIYDDGSKDDTIDVLNHYQKLHPDKIVVHKNKKNLGVTKNFLQAVCNTKSSYIMLCDQDDVWKKNKIEITLNKIQHMEANEKTAIPMAVFTDTVIVDEKLKEIHPSFFQASHLDPNKTDLPHLLMENKLIGCTVMVNSAVRTILQNKQIPQNAKFHDWWIALIAASMGKIGYLKETTLLYRQHGKNVVGNIDFISYIKNRLASLQEQRKSLLVLQHQAKEFLGLYRELLIQSRPSCITIINEFANLHQKNMIGRRLTILKYGFFKTGIVRNIGLMIIL